MKQVKIKVIKKMLNKELADVYGVEGLGACSKFYEGQVFYAGYSKPEGLCDEAWSAMQKYVFAILNGASNVQFYEGKWLKESGVAICSCSDGIRPVIFKLEIDKELSDEYKTEHQIVIKESMDNNLIELKRDLGKNEIENRIPDELVRFISNDTRSIELFDEFEKPYNSVFYKRIVIANGYRYKSAYYSFVIERIGKKESVGNITFTDFKTGKDIELRKHVNNELTDEIIEKYKDKNEFYRFSKPYKLRAQNSENRKGYGWTWSWHYGVGSYTEGTQYGETTTYAFAGVYISSIPYYDKSMRTGTKDSCINQRVKEQTKTETIEKHESITNIRLNGYKNGVYKVIPFSGKLARYTSASVEILYIIVKKNGKEKYLSVCLSEDENTVYIYESGFKYYKSQLMSGKTLEIRVNTPLV